MEIPEGRQHSRAGRREAKLDVAFQLSGVKAVLLAIRGGIELEKAKLNRALGEGGVEVEHMVAPPSPPLPRHKRASGGRRDTLRKGRIGNGEKVLHRLRQQS